MQCYCVRVLFICVFHWMNGKRNACVWHMRSYERVRVCMPFSKCTFARRIIYIYMHQKSKVRLKHQFNQNQNQNQIQTEFNTQRSKRETEKKKQTTHRIYHHKNRFPLVVYVVCSLSFSLPLARCFDWMCFVSCCLFTVMVVDAVVVVIVVWLVPSPSFFAFYWRTHL